MIISRAHINKDMIYNRLAANIHPSIQCRGITQDDNNYILSRTALVINSPTNFMENVK
jgi:hypothetical protein